MDALYNPRSGNFYTASGRSVKHWVAESGKLIKVLRDVTRHEITAMILASNGRKLYLGDSRGQVCAHDVNTGKLLTKFSAHAVDISGLVVWGTTGLASASWDGVVKMHIDMRSLPPEKTAEFHQHSGSVSNLRVSKKLQLLASAGTDCKVVLYSLKTMKHEYSLDRFRHVVHAIDFLSDRCLLVVGDQGGVISLVGAPAPEDVGMLPRLREPSKAKQGHGVGGAKRAAERCWRGPLCEGGLLGGAALHRRLEGHHPLLGDLGGAREDGREGGRS